MTFSAVILAGGKSSRMGRDKGRLEVGGQSLLARQIQIVRSAGASDVFISGRADNDYADFNCPVLLDRFPNSGPLGGIQAALEATNKPLLLVLAVDMPLMNASVLRLLLEHCSECCGAVPRVNAVIEPLSAFYPKAAASLALELLNSCTAGDSRGEEDRAMKSPSAKHFAECCVAAGLGKFVDLPGQHIHLFTNWNFPVDISKLNSAV
jgi:molybdopterin-guanine dinucleotide biosynthesis protein A